VSSIFLLVTPKEFSSNGREWVFEQLYHMALKDAPEGCDVQLREVERENLITGEIRFSANYDVIDTVPTPSPLWFDSSDSFSHPSPDTRLDWEGLKYDAKASEAEVEELLTATPKLTDDHFFSSLFSLHPAEHETDRQVRAERMMRDSLKEKADVIIKPAMMKIECSRYDCSGQMREESAIKGDDGEPYCSISCLNEVLNGESYIRDQ
jgi:hypothetical protein